MWRRLKLVGVAAALLLVLPCARAGDDDEESRGESTSVWLPQGGWGPQLRLAKDARASLRFRLEAPPGPNASSSEAGAGAGAGAVRVLLLDATGDARVGALYALELPLSGGERASLLRCHRPHWAPRAPLRHFHGRAALSAPAAVATAPAGRGATLYGLPGAPQRSCSVAMYFTLEAGAWARGEVTVALQAVRGRVRVWVEGALLQWRDPQPLAPAFLRAGTSHVGARLHIDEAHRKQPHYADGNNIWCVLPRSCKCTPGFHGDFCTLLCPVGRWGEECAQRCGACRGDEGDVGDCDPASGACPLGCRPGFLPPLCIDEVVRLAEAPSLVALNASALEVCADASQRVGQGTPTSALVQYRPTGGIQGLRSDEWASLAPLPLAEAGPQEVRAVVGGLRAGAAYAVRVLLLTGDGAFSPRAPVARNSTLCSVPDSFDYKIFAYVDPFYNKTIVRWMATGVGAERCGVRAWRVRLRAPSAAWLREVELREPLRGAQLDVPPAPAQLSVQALRPPPAQPLPPSRPVPVLATTPDLGPVQSLAVAERGSRSATITWRSPVCCPDLPLAYVATLECERLVYCAETEGVEECGARGQSSRSVRVEAEHELRLALEGLLPAARYRLSIAPELEGAALPGPGRLLVFDTLSAAPAVRLDPSLVSVLHLGSQGFELQWRFPENCSAANGRLEGAHYSLRPLAPLPEEGDAEEQSFSGLAFGQRQRFSGLRPATAYAATLHLVTAAQGGGPSPGWDPALGTTLHVTTLPEGAEEVRVHEAARERVSLRWLPPDGRAFRGVAVTTRAAGGSNESAPAWTQPCARWPAMRCLVLAPLRPDTLYDVWVHITTLNGTKIQEHTVHLKTRTTEGTPSAPRELRVAQRWEGPQGSTLRLQWRAPAQRGGVLRNFVLIVHHVRAHARATCCQRNRIAVVEVAPADADRQDLFEHEVSDLPPASTFLVSLAAVTALAGPAARIAVHTAPPPPLGQSVAAGDSAPPLRLLPGPLPCLRALLPATAAQAAAAAADAAPVRRLFTFLTAPEEERPWRWVSSKQTTNSSAVSNSSAALASTLPDALLRTLPAGYSHLQEVPLDQLQGGSVCVAGAAGRGQRAGVALLLQYESAASAAAWRSDPFDLLHCFRAPAGPAHFACL